MTSSPIVALATPPGQSGVALIRLSGAGVVAMVQSICSNKNLNKAQGYSLHYGKIFDDNNWLDEVLVAVFRAPHSYTGEEVVEISCHGSPYISRRIVDVCIRQGARLALPGEFTQRAFLHGKMDLSQADAVADMIAAENETQLRLAQYQLRGGYSHVMQTLRQELIDFTALLELELDFSEEDVEFADRTKLCSLLDKTLDVIRELIRSFEWGNAVKEGIPVAIIGKPNVGKSTLLNALLNEEKALVSEWAGTTRDFIEDTFQWQGLRYRFIDTAGIRDTDDHLEQMGIRRSLEKLREAETVFYLEDVQTPENEILNTFRSIPFPEKQTILLLLNKADQVTESAVTAKVHALETATGLTVLPLSAKQKTNIPLLLHHLHTRTLQHYQPGNMVITNARHLAALREAEQHLVHVKNGLLRRKSPEWLTPDLRLALHAIGRITGAITQEDVLSSVFSRFCIGK